MLRYLFNQRVVVCITWINGYTQLAADYTLR